VIIDTLGKDDELLTSVVPAKWIMAGGNQVLCPSDPKIEAKAAKQYRDVDFATWKVFRISKIRNFYSKLQDNKK